MFTKNIKNSFTANLLSAVSGVLGEAKKTKCAEGCECESCEAEETQEGYIPTNDAPSDKDRKTAGKLGTMLKRERMGKEKREPNGVKTEDTDMPWSEDPNNPSRKSGSRKDEYGNKVKNVAKHLARKAMKANEEFEQLDELSPKTLGKYTYKAASELGSRGITTGLKIAADEPTEKNFKKMGNRQRGIASAVKKMTKEEAEGLDEISKETLGSYVNKSAANMAKTAANKVMFTRAGSADKLARAERNRKKGIETAVKKLTKEEQDFIDALNADILDEASTAEKNKQHIEVTSHTGQKKLVPVHPTNAYKALNHYKGLISTKSARIVSEEVDLDESYSELQRLKGNIERNQKKLNSIPGIHPEKKKLAVQIEKDTKKHKEVFNKYWGKNEEVEIDEAVEVRHDRYVRSHGKKASGGGAWMFTHKNMGDAKGEDTFTAPSSAKNFTDAAKHAKAWAKSKGHRAVYVMEEVNQIDELSNKTMGSYVKKASSSLGPRGIDAQITLNRGDPNTAIKKLKKISDRTRGIEKAINKMTKEEQEFIDALNDDMFEEIEIAEARGRPRKAGAKDFTVNPITKEKLMHDNPEHMKKIEKLQKFGVLEKPKTEANQHIIQQLQRAKLSMRGGETVNFTHGDPHHVTGYHAAKLLDKYVGMKPDEKESFQKKISHSHANLKSEL